MVVGLLVICGASAAGAQTLYDDFPGRRIDPNLWLGVEAVRQRSGSLDSVRTVKAGRLWLGTSLVGNLGAGALTADSRQRVQPVAIGGTNLGMGATFQLIKAQAQGCAPPGTAPAEARVGFNAALFNDGSSTVSTDKTGDVGIALLVIRRSDLSSPIAEATLSRCSDPDCLATDTLLQVSGAVQVGGDVLLAWQWVPSDNSVLVRANDAVVGLPYTQTPVRLLTFRAVEAWVVVPGCPEGERSSGTAVTTVDNVFVIP